jgi:hypothetical protein
MQILNRIFTTIRRSEMGRVFARAVPLTLNSDRIAPVTANQLPRFVMFCVMWLRAALV